MTSFSKAILRLDWLCLAGKSASGLATSGIRITGGYRLEIRPPDLVVDDERVDMERAVAEGSQSSWTSPPPSRDRRLHNNRSGTRHNQGGNVCWTPKIAD